VSVPVALVHDYVGLFHRRTRAYYDYNGCLAWYNVVLTPRVHSSVKFVGLPLVTRATVELVCYTTASRGISSFTLTYTTLDSCITYTYLLAVESSGRVEGLYDGGGVTDEQCVARGAGQHADDRQPDVGRALWRVPAEPDAQHV